MTGVRAPLIPNHPVGAFGKHVHEFAFAFIAPLRANYHDRTRR